MNKKTTISIIAVLLMIVILLIGWFYYYNSDNPLIGTWEYNDSYQSIDITFEWIFFEDYKFLRTESVLVNQNWANQTFLGIYKVSGEELTLIYKNNLPVKTNTYKYKIVDDILRLSTLDAIPISLPDLNRVSKLNLRRWPMEDKPITIPAESLVISIDDLPEGYKICQNRSEEHGKIVDPIESYSIIYSEGNCSNASEGLLSIIFKFDSSFDASIFYNITKFPVLEKEKHKILNDSINAIGDESFAHYAAIDQTQNDSQIYLWFRISNIVGLIKVPYDYSLAYELAELVEQRINDDTMNKK
jgi:hypothetical protein